MITNGAIISNEKRTKQIPKMLLHTYFHVTMCHFFWHWHYLAKSCDTQMGTNKKRKKKTPENKNDMDRKIKFLCQVLLLPLMPI